VHGDSLLQGAPGLSLHRRAATAPYDARQLYGEPGAFELPPAASPAPSPSTCSPAVKQRSLSRVNSDAAMEMGRSDMPFPSLAPSPAAARRGPLPPISPSLRPSPPGKVGKKGY
jgi:hypothetical protein